MIHAEPAWMWRLRTDADAYPRWNSTVVSLGAPIASGKAIKLVSTLGPGRTFTLKVIMLHGATSAQVMNWLDRLREREAVRKFCDGGQAPKTAN